MIWVTTLVMVVATDLLTGVLTGLALSMLELLPHWRHAKLDVQCDRNGNDVALKLSGRATFLCLPKLTRILDSVPSGGHIRLDIAELALLDHTCAEVMTDWVQRKRASGARIELVGLCEKHTQNCYHRLAELAAQ